VVTTSVQHDLHAAIAMFSAHDDLSGHGVFVETPCDPLELAEAQLCASLV